MGKIHNVEKMTDNRFVNLYHVDATSVHNTPVSYFVASRARDTDSMKIITRKNKPDGVIIYSIYGEKNDRVVLIRQFRYTIGDYIYETGLKFTPLKVEPAYEKPFFPTDGLTAESCAAVYGYASGEISKDAQEASEEIEVVLADREEVKRILREENVAIPCAYMLMHFLKDPDPFSFLQEKL